MLHVVRYSPSTSMQLAQCLAKVNTKDHLLLLADAVFALQDKVWNERLQQNGVRLYCLNADIKARGLDAGCAEALTTAQWVDLVAEQGSPCVWR